MGKSGKITDVPNRKNYGVPLYGAAWVPPTATVPSESTSQSDDGEKSPQSYVVLAGGGGPGSSGIPNDILVSKFDFDSCSLSDQPVAKVGTADDLPYRMAVHPSGDGLICSLPNSCRWFEWDTMGGTEHHTVALKSSEKVLEQLQDVGQQLALTFSSDGSLLAVGGEDGKLRVFKWPTMEIILDETNAHAAVKDLDFSPDGRFLVSVGSGSGRVWDISTSSPAASLQRENDEVFGYCRFSRGSKENQVLYLVAIQGKGGSIVKWSATPWKRVSSKHVVRDPVSAFNVSADGKLLAIGTIEGDVLILNSTSMRLHALVRKAHLGLVTTLLFSQDSRALLSASMDSSARVTVIKDENRNGLNLWIILFIILFAVAAYYANEMIRA